MDYRIVASFAIAILVDIGFPLAVTLWFRRRYGSAWRVWLYGVLVFAVFQLFTRVPLMTYLSTVVGPKIAGSTALALGWTTVAALTAGLVEELGRWLGYRYLFSRGRVAYEWANGVMYGLGHGGLESILLVGGAAISSLASYMLVSRMDAGQMGGLLSTDQMQALLAAQQQYRAMPPWLPLLGGVERMLTLPIQVCFSLLVLQCFVRGERRWLWIAVLAHAVLDFVAPLVAQGGHYIAAEFIVALFCAVALWTIWRLRQGSVKVGAAVKGTS